MKSKIKHLFIIFVSSVSMVNAESSFNVNDSVFSWLGSGHDTLKQKSAATCISYENNDVEYVGADGKINLELSVDSNKVDDFLGIGAKGRARAGAVTYSAKAEFSRDTKANDYSISYNYIAEFNDKKAIKSAKIHPNFVHLIEENKDQIAWKETCGNEFVFGEERGARIFLNFKIIFSSKAEKERIALELGAKGPAFEVDGKFEKISEKMSANTKMTVSAYQIGGDPGQMGNMFCRDTEDPSCKLESIRVADCSMGELKKCLSMISSFMAYANADFKKQISEVGKYSVLKVHTRPYFMLGGKFPRVNEQTSAVFEQEIGDLIDIFNEQLENWIFASDMYKNNIPRKTIAQKNNLERLKAKLSNNSQMLADAINGCYEYGLKYCQDKKNVVLQKIGYNADGTKGSSYISKEIVENEVRPVILSQFCDARETSEKYLQTINYLVTIAVKNSLQEELDKADLNKLIAEFKSNKVDWCGKLQNDLANIEKLEIVDLSNLSLEVIATLESLINLKIVSSTFDDEDYIARLVNVEELFIENTNISKLKFVSELNNLSKFTVINNKKLKNFSSLINKNLVNITAYGNGGKLDCSGRGELKCINTDYSKLVEVYQNQNSKNCFYGYDLSFNMLNELSNAEIVSQDSRGIQTYTNLATSDCKRMGGGDEVYQSSYYLEYGLKGFPAPGMEPVSEDVTSFSKTYVLQSSPSEVVSLNFYKNEISLTTTSLITNVILNKQLISLGFTSIEVSRIDDRNFLLTGGYNKGSPVNAGLVLSVDLESKKIDFTKAGLLKVPRFKHQVLKIDKNKYLVIGGTSGSNAISQIELLDLNYFSNPGEQKINPLSSKVVANLRKGRHSFMMELIKNNEVLIMGGFESYQDQAPALASVEIISLLNFKIRAVSELMIKPRGEAQSLLLDDGKVLLIGGASSFHKNKFSNLNENSNVLILKENPAALSSIEAFIPEHESFFPVGNLNKARSRFGVLKIHENEYLIAGGIGSDKELSTLFSAELLTIINE